MRNLTTEDFIARARKKHGDKFDYSKVVYKNRRTKVKITCPIHGAFWQYPDLHILTHGCPKCGLKWKGGKQSNTADFIKKAKKVHGNRYDYKYVHYVNCQTEVPIYCCIHGLFNQKPSSHLSGQGCPYCALEKMGDHRRLKRQDVLSRLREIHGDKYDYSESEFTKVDSIIKIGCPKHGSFRQSLCLHLYQGCGCQKCAAEKVGLAERMPRNEYIEKATQKHNGKYDYSQLPDTFRMSDMIPIICPEHGLFYRNAKTHLNGGKCPHCPNKCISRGEKRIYNYLKNKGIEFIPQYKISNDNLFCANQTFSVDFYIPKYNLFIEYNGEQHYEMQKHFGGDKRFNRQQERDMALRQYCRENKIRLFEIPYTEFKNIENVLDEYFVKLKKH